MTGGLAAEAQRYWEEGQRAQQAGDLESALMCYQKAVLLNPAYTAAYYQVFAAPLQPPPAPASDASEQPLVALPPVPALPQPSIAQQPMFWPDMSRLTQALAKVHFDLGVAYTELKAYPKAIAAFEKTLTFNPKHAQAHAHLGLLYKHVQNDPERASRHLQAYLQLNPNADDREELEALIALLQRTQPSRASTPPPAAAW